MFPPRGALSALSLVLLLGLKTAVSAQNYVQNSSFESGLAHWNWTGSGTDAACAIDARVSHWEGQSLRFTNARPAKTGGVGKVVQYVAGLTAGRTYHALLWCRGTRAGAKNTLAIGTKAQFRCPLPAGTYDWKRVGLTFVADAATVPFLLMVGDKTADLWVDDVYVTSAPCTDARTLGITGDGKTDVTRALAEALRTHPFLSLPAGVYLLTAPVTVPGSAILWGDGVKTILKQQSPTAAAFLTGASTDTVRLKNVEVSGLRFVGLPSKALKVEQHALTFFTIEGLLVRDCSTQSCGLLVTSMYKGGYKDVKTEDVLSKRVRAVYNDLEATAQDFSSTGVNLSYTVDADVSRNTIQYFAHGIMWWGGDSNLGADGAFANPRWVRRVLIADNRIAHVGGGGIWGSNGANVTIRHNDVRDCGDVGIDFEGCFDSVADSNTVADGHNGGLSSFFAASNVTFSNNDVTSTNPAWSLFRLYNSSQDPANVRSVTLSGNRFRATSGIGNVTDFMGPGELKMIGNTFTNVAIDVSRGDGGFNEVGPTITGNTLTFNADAPGAFTGINVGFFFGNAVVSDNVVHYVGAARSNKTGIRVRKLFAQPGTMTVQGNTVIGFGAADLLVAGVGGNTAAIDGNTVQSGIIDVRTTSGLAVTGSGNKDLAGAAVKFTPLPQ